jgi:hypothetical protein
MTEEALNLDLLIKMMKMTTADDNTTLVAIRKVNSILKSNNVDWETLLRGKIKITTIADPFKDLNIPDTTTTTRRRGPPIAPDRPAPPPPPEPPWKQEQRQREAERLAQKQRVEAQLRHEEAERRRQAAAAAAAKPQVRNAVPNRFPGTCTKCRHRVDIGQGWAIQYADGGRWFTEHKDGECKSGSPRKRQPLTADDLLNQILP